MLHGVIAAGCENVVEADEVGFDIHIRITYTPSLLATGPVPLKKIYFIERTGQENRVVPMSTTERITALLKSPIKNYRVDGNYLRYLTKLAQTPCERLLYHNMAFVAEVIKNDE